MIRPPSSNLRLPPHARLALAALSFSGVAHEPPAVAAVDWRKFLTFCDKTQLTLPVASKLRDRLPEHVVNRTDKNLRDNRKRWEIIKQVFRQLGSSFEAAELDAVVLKGFSHCPLFIEDPRFRVQYDFDFLLSRSGLRAAFHVLRTLGYQAIQGFEDVPLDHLPAMVRKTGWKWKADYFDVEMPLSVELHFQLWDPKTEGFDICGLESFWDRRKQHIYEDLRFLALDSVDMVGYAAMHLVRHLLRGDVRLFHVYEIACLLHRTSSDDGFWKMWRNRHDESLQRISLISFALARLWFDCAVPAVVEERLARLPAPVRRWLRTYGNSPLANLFRPNKDELWLHLSLISSPRRRAAVLVRRLIPGRPAGPVNPVHLTNEQLTFGVRFHSRLRYTLFLISRGMYHIRTLPVTAVSAVRWFGGLCRSMPL